ncbi:hypothetical protein C1H46_042766 [Malus baccata]|uniref:Uncharacterized protein n=1 Tax=Malus baccata TaxID=106549 RepID=A0A540KCN4_MALBA|nr:hypothetical protein C1H46_042766 [Malus baccata]
MGLWGRPVCLFATPATSFPLSLYFLGFVLLIQFSIWQEMTFWKCRGCLGLKGRESAYDKTTWDEHRMPAHDMRQGCDEIHGATGWIDVIRSK